MRPEEAFVANSIVAFLGGPAIATVSAGDDPPDIYLALANSRVGLEVTRLSQFTLEPDGTLGNRATQDTFGLRLLDDLDGQIGPQLREGFSLCIGLSVPVSNGRRFRTHLKKWITEIANSLSISSSLERDIDGTKVTVSVVPMRQSGKKVVGFVANKHSSADIDLNARLVLQERIGAKSEICAKLPQPVWLALLNDYWLADADSYAAAYRKITLAHCFERIFLVFDNGTVSELTSNA